MFVPDKRLYQRSIEDPAGFWADIASQFHWEKKVRVVGRGDRECDKLLYWESEGEGCFLSSCLAASFTGRRRSGLWAGKGWQAGCLGDEGESCGQGRFDKLLTCQFC